MDCALVRDHRRILPPVSDILHGVLLGDDAVCAFVTKRKSTAAALFFVEQHLIEHRCVFGEYDLHSFTVTDNAQGSFPIGKECDLVQIVFDDGLVNYGQAQIIRISPSIS